MSLRHAVNLLVLAVAFPNGGLCADGDQSLPRTGVETQLRRASQHPMRYFFIPPRDFAIRPKSPRPILVALAGAGSDFAAFAELYREARADQPFFIVCPCTFSNTNAIEGAQLKAYRELYTDSVIRDAELDRLTWDEKGLLAVLDDLRREFDAEPKIYLTGFSGGGLLTFRMLFNHPERIAAATPVCPNYFDDLVGQEVSPLSKTEQEIAIEFLLDRPSSFLSDTDGGLLSHVGILISVVIVGLGASYLIWRRTRRRVVVILVVVSSAAISMAIMSDYWRIDSESAAALKELRRRGFTIVSVTTVNGLGHTPAADRVMEIFERRLVSK